MGDWLRGCFGRLRSLWSWESSEADTHPPPEEDTVMSLFPSLCSEYVASTFCGPGTTGVMSKTEEAPACAELTFDNTQVNKHRTREFPMVMSAMEKAEGSQVTERRPHGPMTLAPHCADGSHSTTALSVQRRGGCEQEQSGEAY